MTHRTNAPGRPVPHAAELRWRLLDDLAAAREDWGLKDRTLAVLRALLGFLPKGEGRRLTVFPSNRTLSERLMGMPESTLRRHLARLVETGLIRRRSSPNGKRYRIAADLAFGFDLAPVFAAASTISVQAQAARDRATRLRALRARIRAALAQCAPAPERCEDVLRLLRRKVPLERLEAELRALEPALPPETDVGAARNGCATEPDTESDSEADAAVAQAAIEDVGRMLGRPIASLADLREAGEDVAHALSVHSAWTYARQARGLVWAVMALAYLAPRSPRLRCPDRYFQTLVRRAGTGGFDLLAALRRERVGFA
ncbi:helix-turn-helix domain-containing protein [uncultured Jannaschia sp.]|uniref:helix-turn-helix domain-containing protein n=1 Tax=uncultured Jannaschia sp. TaxID=293347 RepID=UPI0026104179|nr:helix-turn-helix domain-containing protein [uncultured Jannaschia sp.]